MDAQFPVIESPHYPINDKEFILQNDFTYEDLDWLDVVINKLKADNPNNEVTGSFKREEIKKTLKIILKDSNGKSFTDDDFKKTTESLSVKIFSDFFLSKALQGIIINNFSGN